MGRGDCDWMNARNWLMQLAGDLLCFVSTRIKADVQVFFAELKIFGNKEQTVVS
jgi:hypothetical protein